jgi:hypothetical protein
MRARHAAVAEFLNNKDHELKVALDAAYEAKRASAYNSTRADRQKADADLARARADYDAAKDAVGDDADDAAREEAFAQPVWVTLTDVRLWVFLRITGNTIEVSDSYRMFDLVSEEITPVGGLLPGLALMCDAAGIDPAGPQLVEKLSAVKKNTAEMSEKFCDAVLQKFNMEAYGAFTGTMISGRTEEESREFMLKNYPEVTWEELLRIEKAFKEKGRF